MSPQQPQDRSVFNHTELAAGRSEITIAEDCHAYVWAFPSAETRPGRWIVQHGRRSNKGISSSCKSCTAMTDQEIDGGWLSSWDLAQRLCCLPGNLPCMFQWSSSCIALPGST